MKNLELSIETGLVFPRTLTEVAGRGDFQSALRYTLCRALEAEARENLQLEDILLYAFASGDLSFAYRIAYSFPSDPACKFLQELHQMQREDFIETALQNQVLERVLYPDNDWVCPNPECPEPEKVTIGASLQNQVPEQVSYGNFVDLEYDDADSNSTTPYDAPSKEVDTKSEALSDIGKGNKLKLDESRGDNCSAFLKASKAALNRLQKTASGRDRVDRVREVVRAVNSHLPSVNGQVSEAQLLSFYMLLLGCENNKNNIGITAQVAKYKLGFIFGYRVPLGNRLRITPKIGIDRISNSQLSIPRLGITFSEKYLHIPVAIQFHWYCVGATFGYEFDLLLFQSYHAEEYSPSLNVVQKKFPNIRVSSLLKKPGRAFCKLDLTLLKGVSLCLKGYFPETQRRFDNNFWALTSAMNAPRGEINIGLDLLKLSGRR
ncbi:MAG: hypothetical protein AAF400_02110 [Bacteroidota bacterium]